MLPAAPTLIHPQYRNNPPDYRAARQRRLLYTFLSPDMKVCIFNKSANTQLTTIPGGFYSSVIFDKLYRENIIESSYCEKKSAFDITHIRHLCFDFDECFLIAS